VNFLIFMQSGYKATKIQKRKNHKAKSKKHAPKSLGNAAKPRNPAKTMQSSYFEPLVTAPRAWVSRESDDGDGDGDDDDGERAE
jgi:hypothetical protein